MSEARPPARSASPPVRTTCPYCGVGCGLLVSRDAAGIVSIEGDPAHPANGGRLCSKGAALGDTLGLSGRLLRPSLRGRPVDWDVALDAVAEGFRDTIRRHGPDSVALYLSGQLLTEDYYVANKLMKGFIGSANVDTNSRLCMASSVAGHRRAFGADVVPGCYEDLELARQLVLVGSNAAWCHPVLFRRMHEAKERGSGARIVVIDPRRTATCESADLHLPLRPGTDAWLFNGLLAYLEREGRAGSAFVREHTSGSEAALDAARRSAGTIEAVAERCALAPESVEAFYRGFAGIPETVTLYSQGVNQSTSGTDKVNAILNCHLWTGRIGRPGMGPFSLTGQPNAMGGREVGGLANQLAAHMNLEDPRHRDRVQRFWRSPTVAAAPGLKAVELFEAIHRGEVRAVWILGTNPAVSLPDANRVREALGRCPLVVVSDCYRDTDTADLAHILLPALAWGEKEGTVTNSERRISRQRAFLRGPGEARADWWALTGVARRLGFAAAFPYENAHAVFQEHAALTAFENGGARPLDLSGLSGLSAEGYAGLEPVQWPVRADTPSGTARLFGDGRFPTPDGRARFVPVEPRLPGQLPEDAYPLTLNTGRARDQWHTMTRTGRAAKLLRHQPEPFVDMHPADAAARGVADGAWVRAESRLGAVTARARIGETQARGQIFVPIHWTAQWSSAGRVGAAIQALIDPVSGQPEFKQTPVNVAPLRPDWQAVLLSRRPVGAPEGTEWVRIREQGYWRLVMAGFGQPVDWERAGKAWLTAPGPRAPGGEVAPEPPLAATHDADVPQWLAFSDRKAGRMRLALLRDGRLQACLLVSRQLEPAAAGWWDDAFAARRLSAAQRTGLLTLGATAGAAARADPMICSCNRVARAQILAACAKGSRDSAAIGLATGAGTSCGSCLPEIRALLTKAG